MDCLSATASASSVDLMTVGRTIPFLPIVRVVPVLSGAIGGRIGSVSLATELVDSRVACARKDGCVDGEWKIESSVSCVSLVTISDNRLLAKFSISLKPPLNHSMMTYYN